MLSRSRSPRSNLYSPALSSSKIDELEKVSEEDEGKSSFSAVISINIIYK